MASPSSSQPQQPRRHSSSFKQRVDRKVANVRERSGGLMDLPERFKVDDDEDADDGTGVGDGKNINFAHQSMYGMIAAAQSRNTFAGWFQNDSGGESDDDDKESTSESRGDGKALSHKQSGSSRNTQTEKLGMKGHGSKLSENKLARSFLKPIKDKGGSQQGDPMTKSQLLPPRDQRPQEMEQAPSARTDAPILEGKLQAMARAEMESASSSGESKAKGEEVVKDKAAKSLPKIIANMFQFEEHEDVISEYPCWYTQNVLLKGLMYITEKHVCFYSYLHKKTNQVLKQGHIGKRSKHGYLYHRYWFVLKGDVFSYYASSSDPYFPLGVVDLRYAISADVTTPEAGKEATDFTITTPDRVYYYRADHAQSANEWVKQLQRVIFRGHNDGDAVKISLPLTSVLDVEETNALDFAETIKLRALARDDTFAVDEYFFTFFDHGRDVINLLRSLTEDSNATHATTEHDTLDRLQRGQVSSGDGLRSSPKGIRDPIRSTLSPLSAARVASPRSSSDYSRPSAEVGKAKDKRTFDSKNRGGHASSQILRSKSPQSSILQDSTESFLTSSSTLDGEINPDMSASQMLVGDGVFQRPTLRMPQPRPPASSKAVEDLEDSQNSSRASSLERVRVQPPNHQGTEQSLGSGQPELRRKGSGGSGRTLGAEDKKQAQPVDIKGPGRLARGISMPLQHAMTVADMMRTSSKRVSSYLSSSPKYLSNFSDALVGGKRHYTDAVGLTPNDSVRDIGQEVDVVQDELRFRAHFGLPSNEKLLSAFFCWMQQTIPTYGKIYIGNNYFCFRSLIYGMRKKFVMPYKKITSAQKLRGSLLRYPGMVLIIEGAADVFFDFASDDLSKEAVSAVHQRLTNPWEREAASTILTAEESQDAAAAATENDLLQEARKDGHADLDQQLQLPDDLQFAGHDTAPIVLDDSDKSIVDIKPKKSLRIVCLTIGSRGDIQPFIALCKRLRADGHRPKIATHIEFKPWVEQHGIDFAEVAGDPAELMRICVEYGMFTPSFVYTAQSTMSGWLKSLCTTGWAACDDAELLIESPVAMVGIHIAEALQIPYFRAFGMPFTRTNAYPQAFAQKDYKTSGSYNYMSYTLIDNFFWLWQAWQVNNFRRDALGLRPTSLGRMEPDKVPFLYNVSPNVFIPPVDFSEWIKVTGYWFLDEGTDYKPPDDLVRFIQQARDDGQKLVYVGFGSVVVADSAKMTKEIVDAIVKARVRCILSKGWSDRLKKEEPNALPANLPECIFPIRASPHDWLFKQVDAAVHHGGAGTTGASLRAGIPTLIRPFFGDQYFWATRVQDLGVGAHLNTLATNELSKNIWLATHDDRMRQKAAYLGQQIRAENGVETAVHALYSQMEYAEGLIKAKVKKEEEMGEAEDVQDNWTLIDGDSLEVAPVPVEEMVGKEDESGDDGDAPTAPVAVKEAKKKMRAGT